ncbi:MAG TPA: ABC transporter permease, partial [Dehalococcoidia bacterium]|nr:ABC transporter permease [Dehalococcoidia bacterium]
EVKSFPDQAAGEAALRDGDVDALLTAQDKLVFESKEDSSLSAVVNRGLYTRSLPGILDRLGLSYEDVRPLVEPAGATITLLDPAKASEESDDEARVLVAQGATIIIFLALVLYGQGLLFGVAEEKTSRVVEVLMGTLRPEHLLAGKVLGIVVAAVCQLGAAFISGGVALLVFGAAEMPSVALDVALISGVFFVLGILSYSFLYAAVGATVSRQSEAESAQMPISITLMVPYFISLTAVTDNPDGMLARILSLLPPTAPMSMPARVATGDPLPIEIIVSVALMLPWILAVIWLAARLYSGAILHSGPRMGLLAAWRGAVDTRGD